MAVEITVSILPGIEISMAVKTAESFLFCPWQEAWEINLLQQLSQNPPAGIHPNRNVTQLPHLLQINTANTFNVP